MRVRGVVDPRGPSRGPGGIPLLLLLAGLTLGAAAPRPSASPSQSKPTAVRFAPQARGGSSYSLEASVQVITKDVTFEVPPAYKDSFAFWSSRMKGSRKNELYRYVALTEDPSPDGSVRFRKQLSRFQMEMEKDGQILAPMSEAARDMPTQAWEGTLDGFGNVKEIRRVAGAEDPDMAELATPYVEALFPPGAAPRDLKIGDSIRTTTSLPLPARLRIEGLEKVGVLMTRELILKQVVEDRVTFEIKTTYATDPATKPDRTDLACVVGGGGTGEALFDLRRGVYLSARQPSTMMIDVEAPLRPLPQMPETEKPGTGKSHLVLDLLVSGQQTVHTIVGED